VSLALAMLNWFVVEQSVKLHSLVRRSTVLVLSTTTTTTTSPHSSSHTVKNVRISTDTLWRVFHILTEPVPLKHGKLAAKYPRVCVFCMYVCMYECYKTQDLRAVSADPEVYIVGEFFAGRLRLISLIKHTQRRSL